MSDTAVGRSRAAARDRLDAAGASPAGPDVRRALQLGLAAIWVLDGVLQYQPFMFTRAFGQMLGSTSAGNPGVIARPINWDAVLVDHHLVLVNTIFATIQLLLGLGIAWRPTVRVALAASVAWSLGVWWFGEGLGGVLTGAASPLNGAPGAVILYALLAVLLWPADRPGRAGPVPGRTGRRGPGGAGAVAGPLGSLAYFAVTPANRAPQALHGMIAAMAAGGARLAGRAGPAVRRAGRSPRAGRLDRAGRRARHRRGGRRPAAPSGQSHADPGPRP